MVNESFLKFIYEAASMQRWNDHNRPHKGFTELDKQAQKMFFAYVLAKFEEADRNVEIDWTKLIEGGMFEFFRRILLTDITLPNFLVLWEFMELFLWLVGACFHARPGRSKPSYYRYTTENLNTQALTKGSKTFSSSCCYTDAVFWYIKKD